MLQKNDNVNQTDYGYELFFAKYENYCGKILVFTSKNNKTSFFLNKNTDKTYFVNAGLFLIRWIDTNDGKLYQQQLKEGEVWHCEAMKPCSIESLQDNSSITEVNSGIQDDFYIVLAKENF